MQEEIYHRVSLGPQASELGNGSKSILEAEQMAMFLLDVVSFVEGYLWLLPSHVQCMCTSPSYLFCVPHMYCGTHNQCYFLTYYLYQVQQLDQYLAFCIDGLSPCVWLPITG